MSSATVHDVPSRVLRGNSKVALSHEAGALAWLTAVEVLPAMVDRACCDGAPTGDERRRLQGRLAALADAAHAHAASGPGGGDGHVPTRSDLDRFAGRLFDLRMVVYDLYRRRDREFDGAFWAVFSVVVALEHLNNEIHQARVPARVLDEKVTELRTALSTNSRLLAGTELGLLVALAGAGLPLAEARDAVCVAVGSHGTDKS